MELYNEDRYVRVHGNARFSGTEKCRILGRARTQWLWLEVTGMVGVKGFTTFLRYAYALGCGNLASSLTTTASGSQALKDDTLEASVRFS